ncbi:MAG: hypothetical protein K1X89_28035 [Myxococcaceae bacterium]|nr:hypothetical protein [Myxococcaceae bacterium]
MAKINQPPPQLPPWPWGSARTVREKLVNPAQLDRKARKKGDPKNPALASAALLDFIGPAHSADELRLPLPPTPEGHDADLAAMVDRESMQSVAERRSQGQRTAMENALNAARAAPDRLERLKSLLSREAQMLEVVSKVSEDMEEIVRRMREEQQDEAY